jgi:hypothetical protein
MASWKWSHSKCKVLAIELRRLDPTYLTEPQRVLDRRIRRFLARKHIVSRRIMQIAQNTRYNQAVIDDWVSFVNNSIIASKYLPSCIVNIDETNIYFDMCAALTLEIQGQCTFETQVQINVVQFF